MIWGNVVPGSLLVDKLCVRLVLAVEPAAFADEDRYAVSPAVRITTITLWIDEAWQISTLRIASFGVPFYRRVLNEIGVVRPTPLTND